MAEISVEKNSTIIFPAQFMTTVQESLALMKKDSASSYGQKLQKAVLVDRFSGPNCRIGTHFRL
jgi:hypothetical protein